MCLHIVAVDQPQHVHAVGGIEALAEGAVDGFAADDTAGDVDHLQGGFTLVVDDDLTVENEGEVVIGFPVAPFDSIR